MDGQEIWQKEYDISGLDRGKHNFLVRARDSAGNETMDGPYNIIVDPNAGLPIVRIVYPDAYAVIRANTDFLGVASGRFGVDRVTVRLDDQAPVTADGAEYWKFHVTTFAQDVTLMSGATQERILQEGIHTLYVKALDYKGVEGPELQIPFVYDRTPPSVEFKGIETGQLASGNLRLQGTAYDINDVAAVEISSDGGKTFFSTEFTKDRKEPHRVNFSYPFNTTKIPDGQVFFQLRVTDTTGLTNTQPYLLYVDNESPVIQILSPAEGEDSLGATKVTGRIHDAVGLSKFYYEWVGETHEIPIRPGDPYWDINLNISYQNRNPILRVTAVDKSDNQTVMVKRFTDNRKVKTPAVQIEDHSGVMRLETDQSIFGRIAPGFIPFSIIMEGRVEELPAQPSFRISPDMIPQGRRSIRLWAKAKDGTVGAPFTLRVNKVAEGAPLDNKPSPVIITSHHAYDYVRGGQAILRGHIGQQTFAGGAAGVDASILEALSAMVDIDEAAKLLESLGADDTAPDTRAPVNEINYASLIAQGGAFRMEYRLGPQSGWTTLGIRGDGSFELPLDLNSYREGPIHLEIRTIQRDVAAIPLYFPLNRAETDPEVEFITPLQDGTPVNGSITITGRVHSYVPVTAVDFTTDNILFTPIPMKAGFETYEFSTLFDFTAMERAGGSFSIRVTDKNNDTYLMPLNVPVDAESDAPVIIFNKPLEREVVIKDLRITGLARDDDAVHGVYWRLVKKAESADARTRIFAWAEDEEEPSSLPLDFTFIPTSDSFEVEIPMERLSDGEWQIEVYGEDIYGIQGEVFTRTILVSTADPKVTLTTPIMTVYNRGVIYLQGTASDRNGISGVWVSMDNGNTYQQTEGQEDWRLTLNTKFYADGEYALLMRARDRYGRETIDSAMINIDNTPPEMTFQVPYDDAMVGNTLDIAARILDNIEIRDIQLEVIAVSDSSYRLTFDLDTATPVILDALDISSAPEGAYNIRIVAIDLAENTAVASRNVIKVNEAAASEASFFNPLPGEVHTGAINISGKAQGLGYPREVQILANREPLATVPVDKYGNFYYRYPENRIPEDGFVILSSSFQTAGGEAVISNEHPLLFRRGGPIVSVDNHADGDVINGRPWLKGRAWMEFTASQWSSMSRYERSFYTPTQIMVSFDNGRTYHRTKGVKNWKFRLECSELGRGPLPILVRAEFGNGEVAIRRVVVIIDLDPPKLETLNPEEDSLHRDSLYVYGTASEEYSFDEIMINLRPRDKMWYMIPPFIQGLYLDGTIMGATYATGGLGITFFENNVKLQFQGGPAPNETRYPGFAIGAKLIANLYNLPFRYVFGPDWENFSMTWALGADFSYFSMEGADSDSQFLGAVLAQWEVARFTFPQFKYFSSYAFYVEPILWFTTTDVAEADRYKFRVSFGVRMNVF
ncbi:MAG: neuraminidase [Treponema sp.]|nr:neuraminidase [Treponema sp.]